MNTPKEHQVIEEVYPVIPKISIDYGIMERADNVLVISGEFGWNDIGSLDMLSIMRDADENGNTAYGEQLLIDTKDCVFFYDFHSGITDTGSRISRRRLY